MTEAPALFRIAALVARTEEPSALRDAFERARRDALPAGQQACRLLLLGLWARFSDAVATAELRALATPGVAPIVPPVVLLAGGTDRRVEAQLRPYRGLLVQAFAGMSVTVISGGTTAGIAGLTGDLGARYGELRTLGYVPATVPSGVIVDRDPGRYRELRTTGGDDFSPLESLQAWTDIAVSGLAPGQVKLLGINGGAVAAVEYRVALALGARVGILGGSGREADRLFADPDWSAAPALATVRPDAAELSRFLRS